MRRDKSRPKIASHRRSLTLILTFSLREKGFSCFRPARRISLSPEGEGWGEGHELLERTEPFCRFLGIFAAVKGGDAEVALAARAESASRGDDDIQLL